MTPTLDSILDQITSLEREELQRLRDEIDHRLEQDGGTDAYERIQKRLLAEGLIDAIRPRRAPVHDDWQPIEIKGKPLSETIIEERL